MTACKTFAIVFAFAVGVSAANAAGDTGAASAGTPPLVTSTTPARNALGVAVDDILVYSSDTDFTPFDKGAYASSTTYISGAAVVRAAKAAALRIQLRAASMFNDQTKDHEL